MTTTKVEQDTAGRYVGVCLTVILCTAAITSAITDAARIVRDSVDRVECK